MAVKEIGIMSGEEVMLTQTTSLKRWFFFLPCGDQIKLQRRFENHVGKEGSFITFPSFSPRPIISVSGATFVGFYEDSFH